MLGAEGGQEQSKDARRLPRCLHARMASKNNGHKRKSDKAASVEKEGGCWSAVKERTQDNRSRFFPPAKFHTCAPLNLSNTRCCSTVEHVCESLSRAHSDQDSHNTLTRWHTDTHPPPTFSLCLLCDKKPPSLSLSFSFTHSTSPFACAHIRTRSLSCRSCGA